MTCVYEPHIKTLKDDLIKEIEGLREDKNRLLAREMEDKEKRASLEEHNRDLQENQDWLSIILETIRQNGHDREIVARLRKGEPHQDIADWLMNQVKVQNTISIYPPPKQGLVHAVHRFEQEYQETDGLIRAQRAQSGDPEIIWTQVSQSHTLIRHLFDLYFTWVHPVHMLFCEVNFKYSFSSNKGDYCSSTLVNAICAMGCHLLENENPRELSFESKQAAILREGFLSEARKTLRPESYYEMTTISALAVMYLVDVSSGKARRAMGYLRSAVENIRHVEKQGQPAENWEITFWGVNTLNT